MIRAGWIVGRDCLVQLVGARRALGLLVLALFPAAILGLARGVAPEVADADLAIRWNHFLWANGSSLLLQAAGIWLAMSVGPLAASEDPTEGGLLFQLARPVPKPWVFLARALACGTFASLWLLLGQAALAASAYAGTPFITAWGLWRGLLHVGLAQALSGFLYAALGALLAMLTTRPLVWGVAYFFFSEMILAGTHGILARFTLIFHVRSLVSQGLPDLHEILQKEMLFPLVTHARGAGVLAASGVLAGTWILALALGAWQFARREWAPTREER